MEFLNLIGQEEDQGVCDICTKEKAIFSFHSYKKASDGQTVKVSTKSCLNDTEAARLLLRKKIKTKDEDKIVSL